MKSRDFPTGPVVKTPGFQCRGHRFDPWSGNEGPTCCMVRANKINNKKVLIIKKRKSKFSSASLCIREIHLKNFYFFFCASLIAHLVGKIESRKRRRVTEDEMVGWHHWLNEHEFEQTPGDSEGQGSLVCCSPWGHSWTILCYQTATKMWFWWIIYVCGIDSSLKFIILCTRECVSAPVCTPHCFFEGPA